QSHTWSPEQAEGHSLDARTDIWSLGVLLYEMVAGHIQFEGSNSSRKIVSILEREPAPLTLYWPEVPAELQRIIDKSLRKDREKRYQKIQELALDLKNLRRELETTQEHAAEFVGRATKSE